MTDMEERCHCGRPLHYTSKPIEDCMRDLVRRFGACIRITVAGRCWMVPRHYVALHGITAAELPTLGFEEVTHGGE